VSGQSADGGGDGAAVAVVVALEELKARLEREGNVMDGSV